MSMRKSQLKEVVMAIILNKEQVAYRPTQFANLAANVAEVLSRSDDQVRRRSFPGNSPQLEEGDKLLVLEIFWDLILDRVLTIGLDTANPNFPWFRLHSEFDQKNS